MIVKGYNIEGINQERVLNEYTNEYGLNLRAKGVKDIFKSSTRTKSSSSFYQKGKKSK